MIEFRNLLTTTTKNMMCAKKKRNKCTTAIKTKTKKKLVNSGTICLIILFASTLATISLAATTAAAAAATSSYVDTNPNVSNHKLSNNNVNSVGNNLSVINNNNNKSNDSSSKVSGKINNNQNAAVALIPPPPLSQQHATVYKAPASANVLIPKLEPSEFILPSKTVVDPRRKDYGQLRIYQPIQPFPSIFLPRSSYEDLPPMNSAMNSNIAVVGFDVADLSKAMDKRLKNIRNLELGVSVVQVSLILLFNFFNLNKSHGK